MVTNRRGCTDLGKRAVGVDLAIEAAALLGHVDEVDLVVHVVPRLEGAVHRRADVLTHDELGEEEVLWERRRTRDREAFE